MRKNQIRRSIVLLVLLAALAVCLPPVLAANSSVSIMYRGEGGHYIGDTIVFDGINTASGMTALKVTGPGLPAGGVPVYDLNGKEGTGNPVEMKDGSKWRFIWYTSSIKGIDKMQTARYHITAYDLNDPAQSSTTSLMMKRPDFYMVATPDTLGTGDYLQLIGNAEQGTSDIRIQVSDLGGNVLRSYDTSASKSGYFTYAFHVDMPPGIYYITVSSPSVLNTFRTTINVTSPGTSAAAATPSSAGGSPSGTTPGSQTTGTLSVSSSPAGATVYVDSESRGVTPITLGNLAPGSHTVEVRSPGYLSSTLQVSLQAGETTSIAPALVRNPVSLPLSPVPVLLGLVIAGILFLVVVPLRKNE